MKWPLVFLVALCLGTAPASENHWQQAEQLFATAMDAESGSVIAVASFTSSALSFEAAAKAQQHPGSAWYNAGNAWFEAGELGRAIAAYLHARIYRPFDQRVHDSLATARALRVDRVSGDSWNRLLDWPLRWVQALFILCLASVAAAVLAHVRYRRAWSQRSIIGTCVLATLILVLLVFTAAQQNQHGVVIAPEIMARKGPGYQYQGAFNEPLHTGLEFDLTEMRDEWCLITLRDERSGWVPTRLVTLVDTGR